MNSFVWTEARINELVKKHEALVGVVRELYFSAYWHADRKVDEAALWAAVRDAAGLVPGQSRALLGPDRHSEADGEWHLGSEKPWVSGWQWIDYWTADGLPGCQRYTFGDAWHESTIACWRFRGTMPPYAAAPNPSLSVSGEKGE